MAVLEAYDPQLDVWTSLPSMPTPRSGLAAAAWKGRLYVFGGELPDTYDDVEAYDPATQQWSILQPMPTALHGIGAATMGRGIYIVAGGVSVGSFRPTDQTHVFFPPN